MFITVLVPTFRRPQSLSRCLKSLQAQSRPPDEILLVVRFDDEETMQFLNQSGCTNLRTRIVEVKEPGVIAALNRGLQLVQGEILAITDDDAAPHADWLERIEAYFLSDEQLGGVGGRDYTPDSHGQSRRTVGKVQWFGRVIGNHHLGSGPPREVDELKGVNCSYRLDVLKSIGFDKRLRGSGAQAYWELSLGFKAKQAGWKLVYDPAIAVEHFAEPRFDEDQRGSFEAPALTNAVFNQTLILLENLPPARRSAFLLWAFLIGGGEAFGLCQFLRYWPGMRAQAIQRLTAALTGRCQALAVWWSARPIRQTPPVQ